jgi:hypothetical protein
VRAGVDAHQEVDLGVVQQPLGLVDGHVGLGLRIRLDGDDLVALDTALLVNEVDGDLVADGGSLRAPGRKCSGVVVDYADLDIGRCRRREQQHARNKAGRPAGKPDRPHVFSSRGAGLFVIVVG